MSDLCSEVTNMSHNCSTENVSCTEQLTDCVAQDEGLFLVYTIAAVLQQLLSFPLGMIFDKYGTWITRSVAIILFSFGCLFVILSSSQSSWLLFPAMALIAIGGQQCYIVNVQAGNLFVSFRNTIINGHSGAFNTAAIVFGLMKCAYDYGYTLRAIFIFTLVATLFPWINTFFFMPQNKIPFSLPKHGYTYGIQNCCTNKRNRTIKRSGTADAHTVFEAVNKENKRTLTFTACLQSKIVWLNIFHFSLIHLRNAFFIGTFNIWLETLLSSETDSLSTFIDVYAVAQPLGIVCALLNGLLTDWLMKIYHKRNRSESVAKQKASAISQLVPSIVCGLFSLTACIPVASVQYVSIILQVVLRSTLYGTNTTFIASVFPTEHFGKLYGITSTLSGLFSFVQYPLLTLAMISVKRNFMIMNVIFVIISFLTMIHPYVLYNLRDLNNYL